MIPTPTPIVEVPIPDMTSLNDLYNILLGNAGFGVLVLYLVLKKIGLVGKSQDETQNNGSNKTNGNGNGNFLITTNLQNQITELRKETADSLREISKENNSLLVTVTRIEGDLKLFFEAQKTRDEKYATLCASLHRLNKEHWEKHKTCVPDYEIEVDSK